MSFNGWAEVQRAYVSKDCEEYGDCRTKEKSLHVKNCKKRSTFKIVFLLRYDAVWLGRQVAYYIIQGVIIQDVATESYNFQIAVFMKWVGYAFI
jgi:hypothetical protein